VLHLSGEIDNAVVWSFLDEHGEPEPVDVIDADEVTFLCAHGAGLIADWARTAAAAGRPAVLRRPPRPVRRVLELTGWADAVTIPPPRRAHLTGPSGPQAQLRRGCARTGDRGPR
jgi:anti-anti-sigma regulatory factor